MSVIGNSRNELGDEAAFADARLADNGDELAFAVRARFQRSTRPSISRPRPTKEAEEATDLVYGLPAPTVVWSSFSAEKTWIDEARPPEFHLARVPILDAGSGETHGLLPHQYLARSGRGLDPGSRVDGVARHTHVVPIRVGPGTADDLARVNADANCRRLVQHCSQTSMELLIHSSQGVIHPEGTEDGALGIVLVGDGDAENGPDGIAGVGLDRAAISLYLPLHGREANGLDVADVFWIERFGKRRKSHEIAEQSRHQAALFDVSRGCSSIRNLRRGVRQTGCLRSQRDVP